MLEIYTQIQDVDCHQFIVTIDCKKIMFLFFLSFCRSRLYINIRVSFKIGPYEMVESYN